jgi:hypothetical protein
MKLLTVKQFFAVPSLVACFGLVVAACGPTDTTGTTTSPPVEAKYTLENVCEKTGAPTCAMRQSCCMQTATGYDEAGCMADVKAQCELNVADVNAGIMTFDGEAIDACITASQPYSDKCFLEIADLFNVPKDLEPCSRIFEGQLKEGDTCERTAQCQSSLSDREVVQCDDATKKCVTTKFLPLDSPCKLGPAVRDFCDQGLYCDFEILTMKGTCKTATAPGAACTPGQFSFECGLGYICDSATMVCIEARAEGGMCTTALDCKTAKCESSLCVKADPIFDQMECTGMAPPP